MTNRKLFTSESVTEGHPDKICDQISDAVLDAILAQDPLARVACETAVTTGLVMVMGEITCDCYVDISSVARSTIREIGYTRAKYGFDCDTCAVITSIDEQSKDISGGVACALEIRDEDIEASFDFGKNYDLIGAGDQGMMFGYASNETAEFMPMPITLAHKLSKRLTDARKLGEISYLRPDGKTQVTVEYEGNVPIRIDAIVISAQHHPEVEQERIRREIYESVVLPVIPENFIDDNTRFYVNPSGRFAVGGPQGDTGLTGRKIIVDTYGGMARHGGGAFSGKDPTKVDRSASYAARHVAKNIVAAGLADRCEIQIAYAIGMAHPISINVDTFGTGKMADCDIVNIVSKVFDLRPAAIIDRFELRRPIYKATAAYGHFGRVDLDLPWERLDMVGKIQSLAR